LIEILDCLAILASDGETLFDSIEEDATELLSVMLLEALCGFPAETFRKAPRSNGSLPGQLEVSKQLLQLVGDAIVF